MSQPTPFYRSFGRRFSEARKSAGLTQQKVAGLTNLSRVSVANIEAGRQGVALDRVPAYAKALGCRIADLLPPQWRVRT